MNSCGHREVGYKLGDLLPCPYYLECAEDQMKVRKRCPDDDDCMVEHLQKCMPKSVIN